MRHLQYILLLVFLAMPAATCAELVVIVNADNGVERLSKSDVVNIFMGRFQSFPSGIAAFPVDNVVEREKFYQALVGKSPAEINSYWARLVFSGRASPPRQINKPEELLDIVRNNKGAITYIDKSRVDKTVRAVYAFPE